MQHALARRELHEVAASAGPVAPRAEALVDALSREFHFDGAWLALADPVTNTYSAVASSDLDGSTLEYLSGPEAARELAASGATRPRPPRSSSDLPYPLEDVPTWADCLLPAGYREAVGVGLFAPSGRYVGHLALLSGGTAPTARETRRRLARIATVVADAIDPLRSLHTSARLVAGATAGVVLRADHRTQALPGFCDHELLAQGSPLLDAARTAVHTGTIYQVFLWPLGGRHAPEGCIRVTVLANSEDAPTPLLGVAILSPAPDVHGLTARELEVLGFLVDGCSNQEIAAELVLAQRTIAAHVEHILVKLGASTRTLAAVRANREGLFFPRLPRQSRMDYEGTSS
jgi:DNA-binding CsgD family transcriptional regulator